MSNMYYPIFMVAHAFGQRYELPIPLLIFILGGAAVVLASFLFVLPQKVSAYKAQKTDALYSRATHWVWPWLSIVMLLAIVLCGMFGSQEVAENIVPTIFWLLIWIAVPLSCGIIGDWTQWLNPFRFISMVTDSSRLRHALLAGDKPLSWPKKLGWWPATILFFGLASGELIFNQTATLPLVTALGLAVYFVLSALMGLLFGQAWLRYGEVFTVLFNTWGRLGYFRFGSEGRRGFAGGLLTGFSPEISRVAFVALLLVSVSFDGLQSTPLWSHFERSLPVNIEIGTTANLLVSVGLFVALLAIIGILFIGFAAAVMLAGRLKGGSIAVLAGLLPSLLPISFGYLLAHNLEYLITNGQLLFPLIGNPTGSESWPVHLPYPFNDSYEPSIHLLPSASYWYIAVAVIVAVHVIAVILAHRHLGGITKDTSRAQKSEYPWIIAMVAYTMFSLWLLAQPLVQEKSPKVDYYHVNAMRFDA